MKKTLIVLVLFLTLAIGGVAVYLGTNLNGETNLAPSKTKAESPLNCQLDLTQANPKADINMGVSNGGPYPIPEYCPGETGKVKVTYPGDVVIYLSRPDLLIKLNNQALVNGNWTDTTVLDTGTQVAVNDYITVTASLDGKVGIGWLNPAVKMCGDTVWGVQSIQPLLDKVEQDGNTVMEQQCWGDAAKGQSDFDFDDFQIVIAVKGKVVAPTIGVTGEIVEGTAIPTVTVDPLVTVSPSSSVTPEVTIPEITVPEVSEAIATLVPSSPIEEVSVKRKVCGATSTCASNDECAYGNVCADISGSKRCVFEVCLTDGQPNQVCQSDLCTPQEEILVDKNVVISCVTGQNKKRLNYTVILTNPTSNTTERKNLSVRDALDERLKSEFIVKTSIPFKGEYSSGAINWKDLALTANGGRLEIKYEVVVPPSEYGKEYRNSVTVSENGVIRGSKTIVNKIEILPCTALISDQVDRILLGVLIVFLGLIMYKLGVDRAFGKLMWNSFASNIFYKFNSNSKNRLSKADKKEFEKRIRQTAD
jgi:hypothetical protein